MIKALIKMIFFIIPIKKIIGFNHVFSGPLQFKKDKNM